VTGKEWGNNKKGRPKGTPPFEFSNLFQMGGLLDRGGNLRGLRDPLVCPWIGPLRISQQGLDPSGQGERVKPISL